MAKQCAIIPRVKSRDGVIKDSKLFKDLLSFTSNNRAKAVSLYQITKSVAFQNKFKDKLTLDENDEPTLRSMLQQTNLSSYITEEQVLNRLNKEIGRFKRGTNEVVTVPDTQANFDELVSKAIDFNTNSPFSDEYVATLERTQDDKGNMRLALRVSKMDNENRQEAERMAYNQALNTQLRNILASHGISVGTLSDLESRRGVHGITDFSKAKDAAQGIIELIRLSNDSAGEQALPEEFAHFALEALGEHPLVSRLVNLINDRGLTAEILGEDLDTYNTLYNGNQEKMAKEAAGKLLAKHLLNNEEVPSKPYRSLLQRVMAAVKNFFKGLNATPIQRAMVEADKNFGSLARQILNGSLDEQMQVSNIKDNSLYYNTTERIARDKKLLRSIIENELKRLKIYEKRNPNSQFSTNQRLLIDRLEGELADNNMVEGIYTFCENALSRLNELNGRLVTLQSTPATNLNERAKVLRDIRNYLYSYEHILKDVKDALLDEELTTDNRYGDRVRTVVDSTTLLLGDLFSKYNKVAMPVFVDFIKPFLGDSVTVPFGKFKGKTIKAEDLIKMADDDISFFDRWLDSMADSSSFILKILDQAVKKSKERARLSTIDVNKRLGAATLLLEQAGIKDTEWMFEKDSNGKKTGRYISEIDRALFSERIRAMYADLKEKYGDNPVGDAATTYNAERKAWFDANMEVVGGKKVPKRAIYASSAFANLNDAQRNYYDTVMGIKAELDSYLPDKYTKLHNTVKIRKDLLERVKASDSVRSGSQQLWEAVKDQFIRRTDDTDFGDKATVKDFEGNEVQSLPIYYTKLKEGESNEDVSTDIVGTLTAYAAMANDFHEMNEVLDVLETGRDLLRDNLEITKTRGGKPLVEKFKAVGMKVENKVLKGRDERRIIERLNDFFEMQVYGRYMADEGTFGTSNIDKGKVANFVNRLTSLNMLGLNVLSGISNVATGKVMMRIESFAGEYFSETNTLHADRNYGKELPNYLAEIGNRVKVSKLALWDELFNVMQEYETDVREVNFDRKTWFSRMFGTSALFVMNNAGEHWMQNRTSLALADAYKMKAPDGKVVTLWDAMEVVYIDPNNKKLGARLQVKEGYTKEDGSQFTQDDIIRFSRKTTAINQRMHGIYNKLDRSAVQRLAVGRMAIMFRKWIKPSLNRRFKDATYNYDLDAWTEGYYNTTGRFLLQLAKELKEGQFALAANWNNLTKTEKANIRRAATEVGHLLLLMAFLGLMDWSDDKDRPWLEKMIEYQARRLYTELGAQVPGPTMVEEGLRIVKSPAAGINTIESAIDLIGLLNPYNYETVAGEDALLQSGRFKGESRATKLFYESPIIPMNKTIYKGLHPEEGIPFFKQ